MRAALISELGEPPSATERDEPAPGANEAIVDVLASALNPIDVAVGSGRFFSGHPPLPYVPGAEAVGRIARADGLAEGTLVYVSGAGFGVARDGGLAERAAASTDAIVELPQNADPGLAAALGVAGLAGWLPLAWRAPVRADDRVLVLGATGTVGLVAVHAARLLGADRIVATGRNPDGLRRAQEAGAHATVALDTDDRDELAQRMAEAAGGDGPTYVVDALWGGVIEAAMGAVARGARIVHLGQSAGPQASLSSGEVRGKQIDLHGYQTFAVPADVRAQAHATLLKHAGSGALQVPVERVGLDEIAEAWQRQAAGTDRKIVVEIAG
jgi:NADPH:quinone reductase-like Zn-dependent oxidoreductase